MDVWAEIPQDIFFTIWGRLAYKDKIVVRSVCKSWLSSCTQFLGGIQFPPKAPWLMLAEEDKQGLSSSNSVRNFFDLSSGKIFSLDLPETINKKCFSVGFGWLLIIDVCLVMDLFHPLTGRKINLPQYSTFKLYQHGYDNEIEEPSEILLHKAVAFTNPWCAKTKDFNRDCIIVVTYGIGSPAFAKLGDEAWTDIPTKNGRHYYDIINYESHFYAVSETNLFIGNVDGHRVTSANKIAWNPKHLASCTHKYLVESAGELLVVFRHFGGDFFPINHNSAQISMEIPYFTTSFDVVKLIKKNKKKHSYKHEYKFSPVKTLGNRALFVGGGVSFSLPATLLNGCHSDCIYFTDNSTDFYSSTKNGSGYDMGVYNLRDKTIEKHYKEESLSYFSTPFWYI